MNIFPGAITYIINITKKPNATRGFLQRNIRLIKEICYKLMIQPIIEYTSTIWAPHLQNDILKLESIQHSYRSARFVLNDYARLSSVTSTYIYMSQKIRMANIGTT